MLEVSVNKYSGASLLNTIRQIALTNLHEVRPIGFKVGSFSNSLMIGDTVEEDMVEFISAVSSSVFKLLDCNSDACYVWKGTVKDVLSISDLDDGTLSVMCHGTQELLHVFEPISVEIYFRCAAGKYTVEENSNYLKSHGYDTDAIEVIASHHSVTQYFSFKKIEENETNDIYGVQIVSKGDLTEQQIFNAASLRLASQLDNLSVQ